MSEKSQLINKLKTNKKSRMAYIKAHLSVNIPSQIRALRRRRNDMKQKDLAREAGMMQPRISAMERPGETNFNVETLVRIAAAFKVGIIVKFVPFSEMLKWENGFNQDTFDATAIDEDFEFQGENKKQPAMAARAAVINLCPSAKPSASRALPGNFMAENFAFEQRRQEVTNQSDSPLVQQKNNPATPNRNKDSDKSSLPMLQIPEPPINDFNKQLMLRAQTDFQQLTTRKFTASA